MRTSRPGGQACESSLAVLRPVPQPRSIMVKGAEGTSDSGDVTSARKLGSSVASSRSSIACRMFPSVS